MDAAPSRALSLVVARRTTDPRAERSAARALHHEVAVVRYLEAVGRLRHRVLAPQPPPESRKSHKVPTGVGR